VRLALVIVAALIIVGAAIVVSAASTPAAPPQPIYFNHAVMVQAGVTCEYCHTEARRSPAAGMPSVAKCMSCHHYIVPESPPIQQVAKYWERQEPIPWVRVNQLPRFVYFSHQAHVTAANLSCETCHGDVGHMTVAQPVVQMDMGWCLRCHEQQPEAKRLMECQTCHQ
jgi:hypothetical protein